VVPLVKGKKPEEAISILFSVKKRASQYLIELIKSALANAKRMQGVDASSLYVSNIIVSGGPQMKRFRAGSMGRAGQIRKRTSHITVQLDSATERKVSTETKESKPKQNSAPAKVKAAEKSAKTAAVTAKKTKTKEPAKSETGKKGKE